MRTVRASGLVFGLAACVLAGCRAGQLARVSNGPVSAAEAEARAAIRQEQALNGRPLPERTVGISPFNAHVRDSSLAPLAYGLSDLLISDLAASRRVAVVERLRLDALVRELELGQSGRVDSATAPRVGRLVQARYLVLGGLSQMPNADLRIDTRVADVARSDVGRPLAFSAPVARVLEAEKALAFRLLEELGVSATPELHAAIDPFATRSFPALLAYSRGVRALVDRRLSDAVAEFEEAARLDPNFRQAQTRLGEARAQETSERGGSRAGADARRAVGELAREQVISAIPLGMADRPGGPADPAFPTTRTFIIILVNSPR